jgi:hydroxymethylpyrimidine pyrophosphatase-like HAD family hydrolase
LSLRILVSDYDGTIATDGVMSPAAEAALVEVKNSGLRLGLATGRELEDLITVCPQLGIFDMVIAENGAVLYLPGSKLAEDLAEGPPPAFFDELRRQHISFSSGRVIVATAAVNQRQVRSVMRDLSLNFDITYNRDSAMVLPAGINKATGLIAGLGRYDISLDEAIAFGDAENDLPLLLAAGRSVAVANALESVKAEAQLVTKLPAGDGVAQFIRDNLLD